MDDGNPGRQVLHDLAQNDDIERRVRIGERLREIDTVVDRQAVRQERLSIRPGLVVIRTEVGAPDPRAVPGQGGEDLAAAATQIDDVQ
jgi:hypothetical protein